MDVLWSNLNVALNESRWLDLESTRADEGQRRLSKCSHCQLKDRLPRTHD